jgi:hypothetical protein
MKITRHSAFTADRHVTQSIYGDTQYDSLRSRWTGGQGREPIGDALSMTALRSRLSML